MSILTRYVIRAHIGPFFFAFTAVTGLLYLNAIAQRMEMLAGKGLGLGVIGEFMLYSFPHVVALTFPMAVLVAVLYVFSDLTGRNEVTAMAASGLRMGRLLLPLLLVGVGLTGFMFYFNAQVLPESNHRLTNLMADIGSKNPTLELREDVINEVSTGDGQRFFLRALRIDPQTRVLSEVTITDLSRFGENRIIVASSGEMAFTEDREDLFMTLRSGTAFEISDERPGALQRMEFETLILPMRGVGAELERRIQSGNRGDREMTIPQLNEFVQTQLASMQTLAEEGRDASRQVVLATLGLPLARPDAELEDVAEVRYLGGGYGALEEALSVHRVNEVRWNIHRENVYQYRVEIHKKYAIAFACLIFILLGAPFAVRFPQGGVGMVIATSVGIFFLYWMGLIGGERVAERGLLEPWIAMWLPNLILFIPGFFFALAMGRKLSTNRGGGWEAFRNRVLSRKANQRALRTLEAR